LGNVPLAKSHDRVVVGFAALAVTAAMRACEFARAGNPLARMVEPTTRDFEEAAT
jgi:hypothetical protein